MGTKIMLRVRQGSVLVHPKTGALVAYAGELVEMDHPAVVAHPSIGSECVRVEVSDESAAMAEPALFDLPEPESEVDED